MIKIKSLCTLFISSILLLLTSGVKAQQEFRGLDYKFWYQMSIGKGDGSQTSPDAWLEIAKYGTTKGFILPRADRTNISPVEGNFVYDIFSKNLYFGNGTNWRRLATDEDLESYDSAFVRAEWNNTTRNLRFYRVTEEIADVNIPGQTLSLADNSLTIVGGNSVSLFTTNVTEGSNLYFTNSRSRQAISLSNGLTYSNSTGVGTLGGALTSNTSITGGSSYSFTTLGLTSFIASTSGVSQSTIPTLFKIYSGGNDFFEVDNSGNITFSQYGGRTDAGNTGNVLFVDNTGLVKSGPITELDPVASANTVTLNVGAGLSRSVGSATQTIGSNPSFTLINTAPDQTVVLTEGAGIDITGTYPSFTIASTVSGTVSSVGLTAPSVFSVSGSPVTSSGTLALTFATGQTANQVLATPNGSTGAVGLRALVSNDIPALDVAKITTGTFGIARGGTGLSTLGTANQLIRVNAGATALEYFTPSYLTANQTITLSGNVTGSGTTSITTTIANDAVTYAKIQNISASRLLGRYTASLGDAQEISIGSGLSLNSSTGVLSATGSGGTVTSVGLTSSDITVGGTSPITSNGTYTLTLPNINSNVGTFNNLTVNAKGQVTAGSNVAYLTSYTETDPTAIKNQTTAQTANFNITGNGTIGSTLTTNNITSTTGNDLILSATSAQTMAMYIGATNLVNITSDGVGIGNITPNSLRASKLEVEGNVWATDAYILGSGTTPIGEFGLDGGVFIRSMSTQDINFYTSASTQRLRINGTSGNVIIEEQVQIKGGTPGIGKVLMDSDGTGLAEWTTIGGGTGTVTSVGVSSTDLSVSGSPITTSGSITLNVNNDAITYAKLQNVTASRLLGRYTGSNGDAQEIQIGTGLNLNSSTGVLTNSSPDQTVTLSNGTGISVTGTYPSFTIAATNNGTVTSVGLTSSDITVGGTSPITSSGTYTLTLKNVNSNVGTFNNLTVNAKGQVTAASNVSYLTSESDPTSIKNQTSQQASANFNIDGTGTATTFIATQAAALGAGRMTITYTTGGGYLQGYSYNGSTWASGSLNYDGNSHLFTGGDVTIEQDLQVDGTVTSTGGGFNSLRSLKKDISDFTGDALSIINSLKLYNFKYNVNDQDQFIGMIIDENNEVPKELLMNNGTAINTYNTLSLLIKSVQELNTRIDTLEKEINKK